MILVDANLLLYARQQQRTARSRSNLAHQELNGDGRVGLPWQSLMAFHRIATHSRVYGNPLTAGQAWDQIEEWLSAPPPAWIPLPTDRHAGVLSGIVKNHSITGKSCA